MKQRQLGRFGPMVSAVGVGCLPMSGVYGALSDGEGIAAFHRAVDLGVSIFDTADIYGLGHNEELVGRALRGHRDQVIVATKFGGIMSATTGWAGGFDGRPEYVKQACESSLRRLGIDTIDLYQQHRVDPQTPIEDTIGAVAELVDEGKVRFIGMCEAASSDLRRAVAVHPIATLQSEYSVLERGLEHDVLDTCEELGIGLLPYAPLGRGLLGGSLTASTKLGAGDIRRSAQMPRVSPKNLADNVRLAHVLADIAVAHAATSAQVALAWLLAQRPWIVPIPGTERIPYLEENVRAPDLELTELDRERLDALSALVHGPRYSPEIAAQAAGVSPSR